MAAGTDTTEGAAIACEALLVVLNNSTAEYGPSSSSSEGSRSPQSPSDAASGGLSPVSLSPAAAEAAAAEAAAAETGGGQRSAAAEGSRSDDAPLAAAAAMTMSGAETTSGTTQETTSGGGSSSSSKNVRNNGPTTGSNKPEDPISRKAAADRDATFLVDRQRGSQNSSTRKRDSRGGFLLFIHYVNRIIQLIEQWKAEGETRGIIAKILLSLIL